MAIDPQVIEAMARDLYWHDAIPQGRALWRDRARAMVTELIANDLIVKAFPSATVIEQ